METAMNALAGVQTLDVTSRIPRPAIATGASVLAAGLLLLSLPMIDLWPLAWVALVPLMWAATTAATHRRAFSHGMLMGFVLFAASMHWLVEAIGVFAGLSAAPALAVFFLVCAWHALLFGAFAVCLRVTRGRTKLPFALLAPVTLVALEFAMPFVVPAPLAVLQAWVLPVIQIAELTGTLGVTFCLAMVNGALFDAWDARSHGRPWPRRPLAFTAIAMGLVLAFGFVRIRQMDARWRAAPKARIGVVQTNVASNEKPQTNRSIPAERADRMRAESTLRLIGATARLQSEGVALAVWPETAYPEVVPHVDVPSATPMSGLRLRFRVPVLTGAVSQDSAGFYNSAFMLEPGSRVSGRYDKNALFLLGERIPFAETFPSLRRVFPTDSGGFVPGRGMTTLDLLDPRGPGGAWKLGPLICLEDLLSAVGSDVARLHPHALVALVNDGWFGATTEPWEHLAIAVFRSVEQRTAMVRAAQTGASAFIDATGRLRKHLVPAAPREGRAIAPDTLVDDVAMLEAGHTFYAKLGSLWGNGDLFGFVNLVLLGGVLVSAASVQRRRQEAVRA